MVFNSLTFLLFFAIVMVLHNLPFSWTVKKINLMIASYIFYAAWNPPFVILLWLTTVVDWFVAQAIARTEAPSKRRALLLISLIGNLGLLSYFKYGNFLLENFVALLSYFGFDYHPAAPGIILPIGISFYTFVTLSYTIDVYRKQIPPARSFLDFALLVTFFPHLVAGPILRASDFLPQCVEERKATSQQIGWGLALLVYGLFEKVVIADGLVAPVADKVFNAATQAGFVSAWIGTFAFSAQIFLDFDGYSLCAIGTAMCLGFVFPDNFRFPYAAIGFSDFWQRWHISLSSWLRDYLYFSLGGNRLGSTRTYINLMLTMLLGGLWHGAAWHFVIWGGLHGAYLIIERLLKKVFAGLVFLKLPFFQVLLAGATFLAVCVTWVFFRANNWSEAFLMIQAMLGGRQDNLVLAGGEIGWVLIVLILMLTIHWMLKDSSLEEAFSRVPVWVQPVLLVVLMLAIVLMPGDNRAFIYFQF